MGSLKVSVNKSSCSVTYTLLGREGDIAAWETALLRQYPPAGYGTREVWRCTTADGLVKAEVYRSASCD